MRLSDVRPGTSGTVVSVDRDDAVGQRLMELGMVEGARVRVVRIAPFGGPMQVTLDRCRLSIRRSEAEGVEVLV